MRIYACRMRIYACPRQSGRSGVEHRRKPVDTFKWNLETSCLICTSTRGGAALKLFMKTLAPGDLTMTRHEQLVVNTSQEEARQAKS
ncbi:Hypothetical protein SMAX5B_016806 [Scophthalmus maximus]|uniref:Uncharacterized protein n=1 Tax=Scophthalmus maximus TaxID=52904 RepID=A0A2U9CEX4_SCOMX|nr:Hypothetical protein SMAX5B_016806 [Scophthalmus maximus]